MAVKTIKKGTEKEYRVNCQKCHSTISYKGADIMGGWENVSPYVNCPECVDTIIHDSWREYKPENK